MLGVSAEGAYLLIVNTARSLANTRNGSAVWSALNVDDFVPLASLRRRDRYAEQLRPSRRPDTVEEWERAGFQELAHAMLRQKRSVSAHDPSLALVEPCLRVENPINDGLYMALDHHHLEVSVRVSPDNRLEEVFWSCTMPSSPRVLPEALPGVDAQASEYTLRESWTVGPHADIPVPLTLVVPKSKAVVLHVQFSHRVEQQLLFCLRGAAATASVTATDSLGLAALRLEDVEPEPRHSYGTRPAARLVLYWTFIGANPPLA